MGLDPGPFVKLRFLAPALLLTAFLPSCAGKHLDLESLSSSSDEIVWDAGQKAASKKDWESARKADSAQAYTEFLKRYPQGDFVSQARARLEELKLDEDWKSALAEDTAQAYQHFIEFHTRGFVEYVEFLMSQPFEELVGQTGVPREQIEKAAASIGKSKRFLSFYCMGVNQSTVGMWKTLKGVFESCSSFMGPSLAPKSTVPDCSCVIPPPLPIDW